MMDMCVGAWLPDYLTWSYFVRLPMWCGSGVCRRIRNSGQVSRAECGRDKFQSNRVAHWNLLPRCLSGLGRALLSLQVSPADGLPAVVCGECRDQLDGFYRFRENAWTVERRMKEYLASTKQLTALECSEVSGLFLMVFRVLSSCNFVSLLTEPVQALIRQWWPSEGLWGNCERNGMFSTRVVTIR